MKLWDLFFALFDAWCPETAKGEWNVECPELNQCAVTAMIVQDYFGGDLLRCKTQSGDSHYWNRLPDGKEVDFTYNQFYYSEDWPDKQNYVVRERSYVESFPDTVERYEFLKERVEEILEYDDEL